MRFDVVIERDEDGLFVADVPVLPGCHTQGESEEEAMENIREAIAGYLKFFGNPVSRFVGVRRVDVEA